MDLSSILTSLLDTSVQRLKEDLKKIENTWVAAPRHLHITHDRHQTILVYGSIEYKAYVPKRYLAWDVAFTEWDGNPTTINSMQDIFI